MLRLKTGLNFGWRFTPDYSPKKSKNENFDFTIRPVDIPHNSGSGKFNCFSGEDDSKIVQYSKLFVVPTEMEGKKIILHFEGVMSCAAVLINDKAAVAHRGGFTEFSYDITDLVGDSENKLTVIVDTTERADTPPFGAPIDFLSYGGIYREVWMEAVPNTYIKETFIRPMLNENGSWKLDITGEVAGPDEKKLTFALYDGTKKLGSCQYKAEQSNYHVSWNVSADVTPWTPENPKLYIFKVTLGNGDELEYTIGFRQVNIDGSGFYLNGKKIKLMGINRMQNYAGQGFAMPASAQRADADLIKSLGCNAVRTAHYPQSKHFLNRCDEIGLLVVADLPGYKYSAGGEWLQTFVENVGEMISAQRNHPCIVMWGTRPDDSRENAEIDRMMYENVRRLDTSRPIYGVRSFKGGELIEDVYGYNDYEQRTLSEGFAYNVDEISHGKSPVMITEHTGYLYPARTVGGEHELLEQALSHAAVIDAAYANDSVIGAFGWCLCDYNAHGSFGGNDGICSCGICDMNRIPKPAASVYTSQSAEAPVLVISSAMMAGEHKSGVLGSVYAFTNCDSVKLYKNDELVAEFFPDRNKYKGMPHPPILIDDLIGQKMTGREGFDDKKDKLVRKAISEFADGNSSAPAKKEGFMSMFASKKKISAEEIARLYEEYAVTRSAKTVFKFEGIMNGKSVITVIKEPVSKTKLKVNVSSRTLIHGETYDTARIEITAVDSHDNRLPLFNDTVSITCDGALEVMGVPSIPLIGGAAVFYVRTKGGRKQSSVHVETQLMGKFDIDITVVRKSAKELNVSKTEEKSE